MRFVICMLCWIWIWKLTPNSEGAWGEKPLVFFTCLLALAEDILTLAKRVFEVSK